MTDKHQELLNSEMTEYADRLGRPGNLDNSWFDQMVEIWRLSDGGRVVVMEFHQIGEKILDWVADGQIGIASTVLSEMEESLVDDGLPAEDARDFALEVLEGLLTAVNELDDGASIPKAKLLELMGDETKLLWIPLLSQ
jgi:hypothetical protein